MSRFSGGIGLRTFNSSKEPSVEPSFLILGARRSIPSKKGIFIDTTAVSTTVCDPTFVDFQQDHEARMFVASLLYRLYTNKL